MVHRGGNGEREHKFDQSRVYSGLPCSDDLPYYVNGRSKVYDHRKNACDSDQSNHLFK